MSTATLSRKAPPTCAAVIAVVDARADLPDRRRQELASAMRRFCRLQGCPPEELVADPADIRRRLGRMSPAGTGLGEGSFRNMKSLVGQALIAAAVTEVPRRSRTPLTPEWRELLDLIGERHRHDSLSHFARYCVERGHRPSDVDGALMEAYGADLMDKSLLQRPRQAQRDTCKTWNLAAERAGLRGVQIPDRRRRVALPVEAFPASFGRDLDSYLAHLGRDDPFGEAGRQPARPATIVSRRKQILALAAAHVEAGHHAPAIGSLADLVEPTAARAALTVVWRRLGSRKTGYLDNLALLIVNLARHWVKVETDTLETLRGLRRGANPGKGGMTENNRRRLRQFEDAGNIAALLTLPWKLIDHAIRSDRGDLHTAVQAQTAVAIAILSVAPVRIGTLVRIELDRHLCRSRPGPRGVTHLAVPGELVKNNREIELVLPPRIVRLIDTYRERFRPRLAVHSAGTFLFPGRPGPKDETGMSKQIIGAIRKHIGIDMTVHLFRHLAGLLILRRHPGEYETVRRLLGHSSIETTMRHYAGMEQRAAFARYDQVIKEYFDGEEVQHAAE